MQEVGGQEEEGRGAASGDPGLSLEGKGQVLPWELQKLK